MIHHSDITFRIILIAVLFLALSSPIPGQKGDDPDWTRHPLNDWIRQSPRPGKPAPAFGWEGSGDFDPHHRRWLHFGGHDGIPQGFHLFTFEPQKGIWKQMFPNVSPPGVCCVDGANVFDPANRRFVRFPGASLGHGYQWSRGVKLKSSTVWLYDPATNTWTNMRPAPYRPFLAREGLGSMNASATYDAVNELALSFGGQGNSGGTNNLFAYDAYANRLYRLPADNPPSPRDGMGLAYDTRYDCLVLFGSQYTSDEKTWIYRYSKGKWEGHDLDPHPPGKKLGVYSTIPRLAYDSLHGVCLCLTRDTNTGKHETWAFDAGRLRWTKMNPAVEPAASMSRSRNLGFWPEKNVFILETSAQEGRGRAPEIWTYRYGPASPDKGPEPPAEVHLTTERGKAILTWKSSGPAVEYRVYRAKTREPWKARFEKIAEVQGTGFVDKNLESEEVYFYRLTAVAGGMESGPSHRVRTEPRVLLRPVVSVLGPDKIKVSWNRHPAPDIAGYNIYRGKVLMRAVKKGQRAAWRDNDPEYAEPLPVEVRDITEIRKLNDELLIGTVFSDAGINLVRKTTEAMEYKYQVYAYIIKSVNRQGTESGPSPYVLTIPSAPENVLCRERGLAAEFKWSPNPEKIAGYLVYKLGKGHWEIVKATDKLLTETSFTHQAGRDTSRYWIVAVDHLGQEGEPSSPVWFRHGYKGFFDGEWHQ